MVHITALMCSSHGNEIIKSLREMKRLRLFEVSLGCFDVGVFSNVGNNFDGCV